MLKQRPMLLMLAGFALVTAGVVCLRVGASWINCEDCLDDAQATDGIDARVQQMREQSSEIKDEIEHKENEAEVAGD